MRSAAARTVAGDKSNPAAPRPAPDSRRSATIINARGFHARAAAKFVKLAEGFDAQIFVSRDGERVPGGSIMGLLMLAATEGSDIVIEAAGADAEAAVEALARLVEAGFEED